MNAVENDPNRPLTLLIVDDEPDNLDLLEGMLARSPYQLVRAESGREAIDHLEQNPEGFDAVLLDRMMPGMDGIEVLRRMKEHPRLQSLPVILQTAAGSPNQVAQGLEAGAHYYLVKPFDRAQLVPIVEGAVANYRTIREMTRRLLSSAALGLIVQGDFRYSSIDEARELATFLARASGDPSPVAFGLFELLSNAVEHGCLGVGYETKKAALRRGDYDRVIEERMRACPASRRYATVRIERDEENVTYTISDPGDGFDPEVYLRQDAYRLTDPNGRGIQVAKELSFDGLEFLDGGRTVRASVALAEWREL